MAFAVKYSKQFQNLGVNTTYRVDILSEAGGAVITPWKMGADPLQLKSLGAQKDEDKIVIGSEITFEFVLQKHINESDYDALFESEYKEHIVKFYNDDTSTLLWQGYLQPENMNKSLFESNLHIYLSASDALKDLSDYDFLDSGAIVSGYLTGLEIIKLCLTNLGFEYNFIVKLGTKPDSMGTADHTALKYVTHDTRRFSKVEDGKTDIDDCLTVIEKVLDSYSCNLYQYGGKYYIKEKYEANTYYYTYGWDLVLIGNRAASGDVVSIDDLKYRRTADISMLSPVKEMGLKLLNRNMGDELVSDINDFNTATGPWNFTGFPSGDVIDEDPNLHIELKDTNEIWDRDITLSADFSLNKVTENDYIKLTFQHLAHLYTTAPYVPTFIITVTKPDGTHNTWSEDTTLDYWKIYESPNNDVFLVNEDGDYNITITFTESIAATGTYTEDIYIRNFSLIKIVSIEETTYADISFDTYFRAISDQGKKVKDPQDLYFGDTTGTEDLAALIYSGNNTDIWNRAGLTDELSLLNLYALNYLTNRKSYSKYIIIDVRDRLDTITPVNYISFDGDLYNIVSYDKSFRSAWVTLHLKQRITGDVTLDFQETIMSSVDGNSTTSLTTVVEPSSGTMVYPGAGIALSTGSAWSASITNNSASWNTAYSWGDWASNFGSTAGTIAQGNDSRITNGQIAYGWGDHSLAGYAILDSAPTFTGIITSQASIRADTYFYSTDTATVIGTTGAGFVQLRPNGYGDQTYSSLFNTSLATIGTPTLIKDAGRGTALVPILSLRADDAIPKGIVIGNDTADALVYRGLRMWVSDAGVANIDSYVSAAYTNLSLCAGGGDVHIGQAIQEPSFVTGWFGNNWQIAQSGDAEFENLIVRGSARFRELIIDQLAVLSGSQLLSVARGKVLSIDTVNSKVTLDDPNNTGACAFVANDFFWIKNVDIDNGLFSDCRGQITNVTDVTLTLDFSVTGANGAITDVSEGDVIVQRGHPTTASRQNMMYTTVSDTDAPFRRTLTGIDSLDAFDDLDNVVSQEGNLESLDSHDIVPVSPGYGYYSDNVYLSGTIHAADGAIGGWTLAATTLTGGSVTLSNTGYISAGTGDDIAYMSAVDGTYRFWCGDATAADAPFRISKAGALTATGLAELGTSVDGSGWNIAIKDSHIWGNAGNADAVELSINYKGYDGGATKTRNTNIYDGKANPILQCIGGTRGVQIPVAHVVIGSTTITNDAALDVQSTTGAFIPPRMTEVQRDALTAVNGMIIYNTTSTYMNQYVGGSWQKVGV